MWSGFTGRELERPRRVISNFEQQNPNVNVDSVGGVNDDKIVAAIRGGNAPDVTLSFTPTTSAPSARSGAWIDLSRTSSATTSTSTSFPQAVQDYTEYKGTRCAMPLLADVYGLYYNKDMLDAGRASSRRRRRSPSSTRTRRS